jgi:hypothetical protein
MRRHGLQVGGVSNRHKMWSRVPRESDLRITELARASSKCKRQIHPLVRDCYIRTMKASIQLKKLLVVTLKGLVKTN